MHTITYIQNGKLYSISSPSKTAAYRTFHNMRCRQGLNARLWYADKAGTEMIF